MPINVKFIFYFKETFYPLESLVYIFSVSFLVLEVFCIFLTKHMAHSAILNIICIYLSLDIGEVTSKGIIQHQSRVVTALKSSFYACRCV